MTKIINLFGEEEIADIPSKRESDSMLPVIPLSKKKASKNDTPLEKEIRKFNRLITQIQEYEEEQKKKNVHEAEYNRLFQQLMVPKLQELAKIKYEFALQLHSIFASARFTKKEERLFSDLITEILSEPEEFFPEDARQLVRVYLNKKISFLTKREKTALKNLMEEEGFEVSSMDNYDVHVVFEKNRNVFEEKAFKFHVENEDAKRTKAPEITDITSLYKELAKKLHPDLEQDEKVRHEKESLMKDLVKAKRENDLYTMLLIKAKVEKLYNTKEKQSHEYSLTQLKKYNKLLQQKYTLLKNDYLEEMLGSKSFNNGFITDFGNRKTPRQRIDEELAEIAAEIKALKRDRRSVTTASDLKNLLQDLMI